MVGNKNKIVKKVCSILSLAILGTVGICTVVGNEVFATEVYPTIKNPQTSNIMNSSKVKDWLSNTLFKFIDFVKSNISKNSNLVSNSNLSVDSSKITENLFSDISMHPDRYYINYLSDKDIIAWNGQKFYPDNFIRLHELVKILVNSYRYKVWYNLDSNVWLSQENHFAKLMPKYYNTAYEMWVLDWLDKVEDFERYISYDDLEKILQNFEIQYPTLINLYYLDIAKSNSTIKRWELSRNIFKIFTLDNDKSLSYQDTYYHKNSDAIQKLAELDITNKSNDKFYPDDNIKRWDFIVMLVKSYLKSNNLDMSTSNVDFNIKDLDYNSNYAPFVIYAQNNEMIDYLLETVRSENYININKNLSKHEAYHIISKVSQMEINYDILKADKELISRGEVAKLMVDGFGFDGLGEFNSNQTPNSQIEKFVMNIKSLADSKKIARLIN